MSSVSLGDVCKYATYLLIASTPDLQMAADIKQDAKFHCVDIGFGHDCGD